MTLAYYNEFDPKTAAWLEELIKEGLIPNGKVDRRSIRDVCPGDLEGFTQCHFFAGIGGWSLALGLAGWPKDRPVWTGSCPCQPFSAAGKGMAENDARHLWPTFYKLIAACKPAVVMGEQVERAISNGWLDGVFDDLEKEGYTCWPAVLPACGVGGFYVGHRIHWVAFAEAASIRWERRGSIPRPWATDEFERLVRQELQVSVPAGKRGLLCDGLPERMDALRGFGNAINPVLAAEFIASVAEVLNQ